MRSAQKSSRSRGRGSRKGGGGGNNINRVYDSAGPEGKVRGTPQQIIDKYVSLARDAQTSGDRVAAENFLQHAEHYQRILIQAMGTQEQSRRDPAPGNEPQPEAAAAAAPAADAQASEAKPAEAKAQAASPQQQQSPDIGGMAMIDSGPEEETLLVEPEEMSRSQPRRNGDDRPRRKKAAADPAPDSGEAEEASAES